MIMGLPDMRFDDTKTLDRLNVQPDQKDESAADQPWLAARLPAATPGTLGLRPGFL